MDPGLVCSRETGSPSGFCGPATDPPKPLRLQIKAKIIAAEAETSYAVCEERERNLPDNYHSYSYVQNYHGDYNPNSNRHPLDPA